MKTSHVYIYTVLHGITQMCTQYGVPHMHTVQYAAVAYNEHLLREVVVDIGGLQCQGRWGIDTSLVSWRFFRFLTHCQQVYTTHTHTQTQYSNSTNVAKLQCMKDYVPSSTILCAIPAELLSFWRSLDG